jgi:2-polyprenyl-6-methoxyphenol hydroxylase-like FAD-dependent oxidoreductase
VVVVGRGPTGSATAALLARRGRQVTVLEKRQFPRFYIDESLLPLNVPLFDQLRVAKEIKRIGILEPGVEVISQDHREPVIFRFASNHYLSVNCNYLVRRVALKNYCSPIAVVSAGPRQ